MTINMRKLAALSVSVAAMAAVSAPAFATDGYFSYGFGARQKALGGAGVADGRDATTTSLNPAGLTHVGTEVSASMTLFSPLREYEGSGAAGFTPQGTVESGNNYFYVPNMAASIRLAPNLPIDVIGIQMYGNGGMNSDYSASVGGQNCNVPGMGIFCGGKAGVNLQQALLSIAFAKAMGPLSIGVAPTIARQSFEANGIGQFNGFSTLGNVGSGTDVAWGWGIRAGLEYAVTPGLRIGVAGNTPMWMQSFDKYRGLFAEQGDFDIPASITAGFAYDVSPALTFMFDYKHIWYSKVAAIANPLQPNMQNCAGGNLAFCLGGDQGMGFGWSDVDVFKFGVEYRMNPALTLRAGYSYNTNPLNGRDVMFNILAPATVQHHFTGGLEYKYNRNWSFELAGAYVPRSHVDGFEPVGMGAAGMNSAHAIDISMEQWEITAGVKYKFGGAEPAPLK
jgi:long-chain fatty acid transport protein